jgi:hypothetical protein
MFLVPLAIVGHRQHPFRLDGIAGHNDVAVSSDIAEPARISATPIGFLPRMSLTIPNSNAAPIAASMVAETMP